MKVVGLSEMLAVELLLGVCLGSVGNGNIVSG